MTDDAKQELTIDLKRWGAIFGLLVGLWVLTTAAKTLLDDRYVRHPQLNTIQSDVRVIRSVLCQSHPAACQP